MAPRSRSQRIDDTLAKLRDDVDVWVASADAAGNAYILPLSFYWDGATLTLATPRASRTAVNLLRAGTARVALGPTRDVVIIDGTIEELPRGAEPAIEDGFAEETEFDPRTLREDYVYLRVFPRTIQAWREADELAGRHLMREGAWLA
jgi:hypothetical protein